MEDLNYPICILKMNLQCCEDLPSRVKRLVRKLKGVFATIIDPEKGLILVFGTVEPPVLITAIENRIGQSPQLYVYEKDPAKAKKQFRSLLKRYRAEEPEEEPPDTEEAATSTEQTCPVGGNTFRDFRYPGPPMGMYMPVHTMPQPNGPPGCLMRGKDPRYVMVFERTKTIPKATPAPYPFDFYESKGFPATDSAFRYFSDDHAQPCTIM